MDQRAISKADGEAQHPEGEENYRSNKQDGHFELLFAGARAVQVGSQSLPFPLPAPAISSDERDKHKDEPEQERDVDKTAQRLIIRQIPARFCTVAHAS